VSTYDLELSTLSLTSIVVASSFGYAALERQDHVFEDFVFFIPPDCLTSTPVASMKQASRKCLAGWGAVALAGVNPSRAITRVVEATRH
jgi:hypothetical protein